MSIEQTTQGITRDALQSWRVALLARDRDGAEARIAAEDQLLESRRLIISDNDDVSDLWVFGYGSLIYNPIIEHSQRAIASIYGYHRRLCLWTEIGRGSPDCPGLVLSLDRGGSCKGVAFRLSPKNAIDELDLLWRREMMTMAYRPRLLSLHTDLGLKRGLAFVADPALPAYAPPMSFAETVEIVAKAAGFNGPCRDYLFDTIKGMRAFGIRDHQLEKLATAVQRRLASS